jgi:dTDP-4-dehydrorhamnose reductase
MRIVITGADGQLGTAMVREFSPDHEVVPLTVRDLDITDHGRVLARVESLRPAVIINCAAYTDVDGAEDDPVAALAVNAFGVRSLAVAAVSIGATLVHYSTDFVFNGRATESYTEQDEPAPRSFYAASKLIGEWFAREAGRHYVLRVESLFGGGAEGPTGRRASVDRIIDALLDGRDAPVFVDRTVSPSYIVDVARATRTLLERSAPHGLYHCVNSGHCTWHELGLEIARLLAVEARLLPVEVASVKLRAERPQYCALSNLKLASAGFEMPSWQDALARYLRVRARGDPNIPIP